MSSCQTCGAPTDLHRQAEQWLPMVGFEGLIEVSDHGRVRSLDRVTYVDRKGCPYTRIHKGKILKQSRHPQGYMYISLAGGGKLRPNCKVHHLVLEAFVGPCPDGMECCHANDVGDDNHLSNLRWDTPEANAADRVANGGSVPEVCRQGHEYTPDNVKWITNKRGTYRTCIACQQDWKKKRAATRKLRMRTDPSYAERCRRRDREAKAAKAKATT